jgi:uncharacterized protein YndB with AHSA1/START domain
MSSTQAAGLKVEKTIVVEAPVERAWTVFTEGLGTWWPLRTHSIGEERAESVVIEPRVGGRILETMSGGGEAVWGYVVAWEPPSRLVVSWHPTGPPEQATELEIRFVAEGDRATRVELEHRGWERLGDRAAASRDNYDNGWAPVLDHYVDATRNESAE